MKHLTRMTAFLVAALLTSATFVGCADTPTQNPASGTDITNSPAEVTDTTTEGETDPVRDALSELRETTDWGDEDFGILYMNLSGIKEELEAQEKADSQSSSAVINEAVYNRNVLFEEYAHLNLNLIPVDYANYSNRLMGEVQTGTGDFELCYQTSQTVATLSTSGYYYNFFDLHLDYETPWWDRGPQDFALNGKVFFMNGPFDIYDDDVTFVMLFNKSLRDTYRIENPYDTVRDGRWTLQHFNELAGGISMESSGDGIWNEFDTYGFATPPSVGTTLFYGAGLQFVNNSPDMESPALALSGSQMEKALNVLSIARTLVQDNHTTYVAPIGQEGLAKNVFMEGRSLFYCEAALYLRSLNATMDAEYGILPVPKYSVDQEHYTTWVAGVGSSLAIPASVGSQDTAQFANVLEIFAVLSQKFVRPAYYDTMLTTRNVHDAESAEIIDDIFAHRIYDMANYFSDLGLLDMFAFSVIGADTFTSDYKKISSTFDIRLNRILSKLDD